MAVFLKRGCHSAFWLNIVLTIFLFWIGGFIHAVYEILTHHRRQYHMYRPQRFGGPVAPPANPAYV